MSAIMAVIRRTVQPLCERAPTDATRARASARRTPPTQLHLFQRQTMTMTLDGGTFVSLSLALGRSISV